MLKYSVFLFIILFPLSNPAAQNFIISGTVTEKVSGEAVIGASVVLYADTLVYGKPLRSAITNKYGFYSFSGLDKGHYTLSISGISYHRYVKNLSLQGEPSSIRLHVSLQGKDTYLPEITIHETQLLDKPSAISTVAISMNFIQQMPAFGGEVDIFRTLQLLPGVKAANEISSGLYVRGGSPDQNLTLLDGVVVYNPSHLGGFLSTFNADAIRNVQLIKGAFPAEYGGRISSIIDLTMKEGTKEKISGAGGISLINSRLTLEGPLSSTATFMVSGRRMYLDLLIKLFTSSQENPPQYYFYDLNAKVNYTLSENDRLYISGYFGRDVLQSGTSNDREPNFGINWGNSTGSLRWMHIISPAFFSNFSAIYTDYNFSTSLSRSVSNDNVFNSSSWIRDFTIRGDLSWFASSEHTFKTGAELTLHKFTTLITDDAQQLGRIFGKNSALGTNSTINSLEIALYLQDEWQLNEFIKANLGIRFSYFQAAQRFLPEPRISLLWFIHDNLTVKGAFAVTNQFLHLVTNNDITLPTDSWFPSTKNIQPANATHYVLGAEQQLWGNEVLISIEAYYKTMQNLQEFRENAKFSLFAPLESQLTQGTGEAYGVEVFFHKRAGSFTGWLGYTLSWTTRTFQELNDGKPFYPRHDRRHDISLTLSYKLGEAWEFGGSWVYQTGQAYTVPNAKYLAVADAPVVRQNFPYPSIWGNNTPTIAQFYYTERNGYRLPAYHRLDLNFTHYFSWFGLPFHLSLNLYNAYSYTNPFAWEIGQLSQNTFTQDKKIWYNSVTTISQNTLFPIIPTIGIGWKF